LSTALKVGVDVADFFSHLPQVLAPVIILWLTLRIPRILGVSVLNIVADAGQAAAGVAMVGTASIGAVGEVGEAIGKGREARSAKKASTKS